MSQHDKQAPSARRKVQVDDPAPDFASPSQTGIVRHIFFSQFTSEKHVILALQTLQLFNEAQK
jgi:hypothetical protein